MSHFSHVPDFEIPENAHKKPHERVTKNLARQRRTAKREGKVLRAKAVQFIKVYCALGDLIRSLYTLRL